MSRRSASTSSLVKGPPPQPLHTASSSANNSRANPPHDEPKAHNAPPSSVSVTSSSSPSSISSSSPVPPLKLIPKTSSFSLSNSIRMDAFPTSQLPSPRIPMTRQSSMASLPSLIGKLQPEEILVRLLAQIEKPGPDAFDNSDVFQLLFKMLLDVSLIGKKGNNELDIFAVFFGMFSVCPEVAKYGLIQKLNEYVSSNTRLKEYCVGRDHIRRLLELTLTEESGPVLGQLILLVQTLGLFTFGVTDLKSMFRMLQSTKGVRPRNWSLLLQFLQKMSIRNISTATSGIQVTDVDCFFDFNGSDGTGIGLPASNIIWPTATPGYAFLTWLRVESFEDPHEIANFRPHIFSFSTSEETSQGITVYFQSRQLNVSVQLNKQKREVIKFNRQFEEKRTYCIAISHVHRLFKSEITLFVDGQVEESNFLLYPRFDHPLAEGVLGSGKDALLQRSQPFYGQMASVFFFTEPITPPQVKSIFSQGPKIHISEVNRLLRLNGTEAPGTGATTTSRFPLSLGFGSSKVEVEETKILIAYAPPAVSGQNCIEISSKAESKHATLLGETTVWKRQNLPQTLYSIGGMKVLLPLFLQLADKENPKNLSDSVHTVDPFRLMISLLQILLQDPNHQEDMLTNNEFFLISLILQSVAPSFWTLETMMSLDQLCTSISTNEQLYRQFILSLYLNFRIWIYTNVNVQSELIRILASHMKKKTELFRTELFGVEAILDVIHTFYWTTPNDYSLGKPIPDKETPRDRPQASELAQLRSSLLSMALNMIGDTPTFAETKALVIFAVEYPDTNLVEIILKYLLKILCGAVERYNTGPATTPRKLFGGTTPRPIMEQNNVCSHLLGLGDMVPFLSLLNRPNIKIRIRAVKIIGALLGFIHKLKGSEGVDYFFPTVKAKLSCFPLTELTYNTLKEILLGRITLTLVSSDPADQVEQSYYASNAKAGAVSTPPSDDFVHPKMINVIFELLWPASKTDVVRLALKDFLLLVDLSHQNRRDFIAHPLWPMWLLELLCAQTSSNLSSTPSPSSPLVNVDVPVVDDIKSLILRLICRLLQGCLHDLYGWKQFISLRAFLSQYANRQNLDCLRLFTTFNRSVLHYIIANNFKLLEIARNDPILCENIVKWVSSVEMAIFSPLSTESRAVRQTVVKWAPATDDLFVIGAYRSTLDNSWADFEFAQEMIQFIDALIPILPPSSPRASGSKSPILRFYFRLLLYSLKEAVSLKDQTKDTSNNYVITTLQSIFRNNIEEITSSRFHNTFAKFIHKKKNAFEDQKNRLQIILQLSAERLRSRVSDLWKTRGSNSQHLEHRTVYLLSFLQSITKRMQEDVTTIRSESSIAPLLEAFSDILILARDNTDWGAEFQGIPTEAMIQFFLAHLSEPDHKFALSSLFEESVAAVLQEEMQFQDIITSYLESESANVYEVTGHASAHDNNCSVKFEQKALFFMADKLAVEANRKRTAFLDREHRQQVLVKQWRQLTRKALYHSRGAWTIPSEADESQLKWKLDVTENILRMRKKLKRNYGFTDHAGCANDSCLEACSHNEVGAIEDAKKTLENSKGSINKLPDGLAESPAPSPSPEIAHDVTPAAVPDWETDKKKILMRVKAELIQPMLITIGEIEITATHFYFLAHRCTRDIRNRSGEEEATNSEEEKIPKKNRRWNLRSFRAVYRRRFLLQHSAFEIFVANGRNYFFNITTHVEDCEKMLKKLIQLSPRIDVHWGNPATRLKVLKLTEKWQKRQISNFEYLMQLNSIAGRTYNDLTQYPIFPWILSDYTSPNIDLRNKAVYRDLSKPIGALNPKRLEIVLSRFEAFDDPLIPKFHYGSHYSNIGIALYFLIRLEPFTTYNLHLQEGHFDHADRLFNSIPAAWNNCMVNPADVKELIPEFFYMPEFLTNSNGFFFGRDQDGNAVNDVELPPWASTPDEFIRINRAALESEYVSEHLHEWIDLIFGYKQRGPAAEEAHNLFFHLTYEGVVNLDSISDPLTRQSIECQIINFGQTPPQLFIRPHVKRASFDECFPFRKQLSLLPQKAASYTMQTQSPIIYIGKAAVPPNSNNQPFVVVHRDATFTECTLSRSADAQRNLPFTFSVPTLTNNRSPKGMADLLLTDESTLLSGYFTTTVDAKTIICGGHWDDTFKFISLANGEVKARVTKHKDKVVAVTLGEDGATLVTGSHDTTAIVWDVNQILTAYEKGLVPKPLQILCGHDDPITSVSLNVDLDVVVSGSLDQTVILHNLSTGVYVRSILCGGAVRMVHMSPDGDIYVLHDKPQSTGLNASNSSPSAPCLDESHQAITNSMGSVASASSELYARNSYLTRYSINGEKLRSIEASQEVGVMAISKDGRYCVTSGDQMCIAIRNANLELVHVYYSKAPVNCLCFSTEGDFLIAGLMNGKIDVYPWDDSRWR